MSNENILHLYLKDGLVKIELFADKAPEHVNRIKALASSGFYDSLKFHRVIDGFMAQGGCPYGLGIGGTNHNLKAEFNDTQHTRGVCSMARSQEPNSASTQFFIVLKDAPHLDGQYTAWGRVTEGMHFVDNIKKGNPATNGTVDNPDKIVRMILAKDDVRP